MNAQESNPDTDTAAAAKPSKTKAKTTKRGGGGAWRAFVHHRAKGGQKLDSQALQQLSNEYRQLGEEELSMYQAAGKAAALAHKEGFKAFGGGEDTSSPHDVPKRLQPGDIQPSTGAIVASDYELNESALIQYLGPDFFNERYEDLKKKVNAEGKQAYLLETITKEEQLELEQFQDKAAEEPFLSAWRQAKYSFLTSAFIKVGSHFSDLVSLHWVPSLAKSIEEIIVVKA